MFKAFINRIYFVVYLRFRMLVKSHIILSRYLKSFYQGQILNDRILVNIRVTTHIIEKGLTMPITRLGFGQSRVHTLLDLLDQCRTKGLSKNREFSMGVNLLKEYIDFHRLQGYYLEESLVSRIESISESTRLTGAKQLNMSRKDYFKCHNENFELFSKSRRSVRNFAEAASPKLFESALELANNAPSACNRQAHKVRLVKDKSTIKSILSLQGGTRGFSHTIPELAIITIDYHLLGRYEEHDAFFNSGLFATNLMYALHYYKIGSVFLNWSVPNSKDRQLRRLIEIPANEVVTVLFAFGQPSEDLKVCRSEKKSLNDTLIIM